VLGELWRSAYIELLGADPAKVMVLRNPVSLPETLPDRCGDSTVTALFLGRFGHRKGSDDLLDAVAALPAPVRARLRLRMAGDGPVAATARAASRVDADVQVSGVAGPGDRSATARYAESCLLGPGRA